MTLSSSFIQKWLETARWAASGGNAQPWSVEFEEKPDSARILLSIDPAYIPKHSPLDARGAAAVLSLGCLTTNLIALAAQDEYELAEKTFKKGQDYWNSSVLLTFKKAPHCGKTYTTEEILNRQTNRYPFSRNVIPEKLRSAISEIVGSQTVLSLHEFAANKEALIQELVKIERIRWQTNSYFQSFLSEVNFDSDLQRHPDRIPVSQLGLAPPDQWFMKLISRWPWIRKLLGPLFAMVSAQKALVNYAKHCDRVYLIQAKANEFEHCFELGRAFQEIWLETHRQGIAFQPLGIPLVALGYWEKEPELGLMPLQELAVEETTAQLAKEHGVDLHLPTIGFRVGYPTRPTERAPRKALVGRVKTGLGD